MKKGHFWKTLGITETNGQIQKTTPQEIPNGENPDILSEGLLINANISIEVPMLIEKKVFQPDKYKLKILGSDDNYESLQIKAFSESISLDITEKQTIGIVKNRPWGQLIRSFRM